MAQLNVNLSEEQLAAVRHYAARRRTPVSGLVRDYLAYLLAGSQPVTPPSDDVVSAELAEWAQHGGSFAWLAEEPEIYTLSDGEPVWAPGPLFGEGTLSWSSSRSPISRPRKFAQR